MTKAGNLSDVRERLKSNKLQPDDLRFLDGLLTKAESEGLGARVGEKRVVARLPNGMDLVK